MDFVFMLTRADRTVADCLAVADQVLDPGAGLDLRHVGFKDVGVPAETLAALAQRIRAAGATSYLEVVSTSPERALASARVAREIGVDVLLGGTDVAATLAILAGTAVAYCPFPGRPFDHPTQLAGSAADIEADCRRFAALGCAGVDLLAYRATEAAPLELVRAARRATPGRLIVAGSVERAAQIAELAAAGADAFTVGSAAFAGTFAPGAGPLLAQLRAVAEACR